MFSSWKKEKPDFTAISRVREKLERYAELIRRDGFTIIPYESSDLKVLTARSIHDFEFAEYVLDVAIAAHTVFEGAFQSDLHRTKTYFWRAVQHLGLKLQDDFMDLIDEGDVLEIYDLKNRQIYRNLEFFTYCPYSLEQVIGVDWTKASKREMKLSFSAFKLIAEMRTGLFRKTRSLVEALPEHRVTMCLDENAKPLKIQMKWGSTLMDHGKVVAFVTTNRTRFA